MRRALFLALAVVGVSSSSFALTLSGDFLQINVGSQGALIGDGAVGNAVTGGIRFDKTGTGTFGSNEEINDWGYASYARSIAFGGNGATHYSGGTFGSLTLLAGPTVTDSSSGTTRQAVVTTVYLGLVHVRTYTFDQADKAVRVNDSYTNISTTAQTLATIDSFDPDHGIPQGLGFGTSNDVVAPGQVNALAGTWLVYMKSADGGMANVAAGLESYNPFDPLNDPNGAAADVGISMQYDFGIVRPNQCIKSEFVIGSEAVPDPATLATLGFGLIGLASRRRKKA